jgi:hypothetical protein
VGELGNPTADSILSQETYDAKYMAQSWFMWLINTEDEVGNCEL